MSSKPKKLRRPTPIDPLFRVPSGAEDEFTFTDEEDSIFGGDSLTPVSTPLGVVYRHGTDNPDGGIKYLPAPTGLVIYDQKLRRAKGVVVVDIVAQFDDVPNADRYELRVFKV